MGSQSASLVLQGAAHCASLTHLDLSQNRISDVMPNLPLAPLHGAGLHGGGQLSTLASGVTHHVDWPGLESLDMSFNSIQVGSCSGLVYVRSDTRICTSSILSACMAGWLTRSDMVALDVMINVVPGAKSTVFHQAAPCPATPSSLALQDCLAGWLLVCLDYFPRLDKLMLNHNACEQQTPALLSRQQSRSGAL